MAVVNVKSTLLTNRDASPPVFNPTHQQGGALYEAVATFEVANGDNIGSTWRVCQVPSHARVTEIDLFCDAVTSLTADVGLYQTTANGAAVVAAGTYGTAIALGTANVNGIKAQFEARNIDRIGFQVWQDAGLSADPGRPYDIVLTATADATAAGTVSVRVRYVVP